MNLVLAALCFLIMILISGNLTSVLDITNLGLDAILDLPLYYAILAIGFIINSWLALFNMIPFWQFDGAKVFKWNKPVYLLIVIISLGMVFLI
jgi:Zn-dependent protease